jgi:hypothetical protein
VASRQHSTDAVSSALGHTYRSVFRVHPNYQRVADKVPRYLYQIYDGHHIYGRLTAVFNANKKYMSIIHLHQTTNLTAEQYVAGLTDFGPCRSKLFGNSADEYLKLHDRGRSQADVTEGSGGIWERLHYDWSDPNRVVLTTTDSNVWGGASGHIYIFTRRPNGTTDIDVVVVREGKNLKGRVLGFVLGTIGRRVLKRAFENSVNAIAAWNVEAREGVAS